KGEYSWPARMLAIGLPLAIAFGAAASAWFLGLPFGFALLLGVVLAPTDAALAEPVLENRSVPARIRQSLNVESGLNDGLALPALLIATGLIEAEEGMVSVRESFILVVREIGFGTIGGFAIGILGAYIITRGRQAGWMDPLHQKIAALSLALAGFAAVQLLGGSGFVAVFIAGAVMSHRIRPKPDYLYDFAEAEGHVMVSLAFLFVGAGPITKILEDGVAWEAVIMALLALIVIRPLAIALSLLGEKLMPATIGFLGWFGPRGLATIVFYLVAVEELPEVPTIVTQSIVVTLALSILLHGITATPAATWLSRKFASMDEDEMPEMGEAAEYPTRRGMTGGGPVVS
ncbi:MAG: cation:proton antiporter, partial [Acidimicrobiia bacterium]